METTAATRRVYFHDPEAPRATVVAPSVFVAARNGFGRLLLVRRCDSGAWELPGGRVEVGEDAVATAVRETAEEAGVKVRITGLVGLYTDPEHVVRAVDGSVRQQFVVVFSGRGVEGAPVADGIETSEAAWVAPRLLDGMDIAAPARGWIADALVVGDTPGPP
ncbi:MAG TPA: NUDIX domain-containing protein [Pseudonocardia sp.]|jgi:8-oxo-dGTP pyrophosphatase MutT (NUDIX family)|uniref:NUDIX hydrolase n=1 Tax=Pseudonocardia sp. TaxID=60912 RepID=UPI002B4AF517|nr:NUDIX domain-containing protein [Pseudonocardia sp.]HLU58078.1 NUDIX domain-containing protein [Pseudonocardia sp.]